MSAPRIKIRTPMAVQSLAPPDHPHGLSRTKPPHSTAPKAVPGTPLIISSTEDSLPVKRIFINRHAPAHPSPVSQTPEPVSIQNPAPFLTSGAPSALLPATNIPHDSSSPSLESRVTLASTTLPQPSLQDLAMAFIAQQQALLASAAATAPAPSLAFAPTFPGHASPAPTQSFSTPNPSVAKKVPRRQPSSANPWVPPRLASLVQRYSHAHERLISHPLDDVKTHFSSFLLVMLYWLTPFFAMYTLVHWSSSIYAFFMLPSLQDNWMKMVCLYISLSFFWAFLFLTLGLVIFYFFNQAVQRHLQDLNRPASP